MSSPVPVAVFGATGLTGSNVLSQLLMSDLEWKPVLTISRRAPKAEGPSLNALVEPDTSKWASALSQLTPPPSVVISALGTTRAAAGGVEGQRKIDHDLNIELAKAARDAGVKTFVFVSSAGTRGPGHTHMPYAMMKIGVEDKVKELGFDNAIIMRPGTILGEREQTRTAEGMFQSLIRGVGKLSPGIKNTFGQEVDVIARATIKAARMAAEGKAPSKYWVVESKDIISMGQPADAQKEAAAQETATEAPKE